MLASVRYWGKAIGVSMNIKPLRLEEVSVFRRFAPAIGLVAGLAPAMFPALARAQVNIDQGKSPAEIYSTDCATCHKTPRGLAAGKNSLMLSAFLREHYTASRDQAAALAAYVLGAGGAEPAPKQKPEVEHARAEEPKAGEPKTSTHPVRASAKPEGGSGPNWKKQSTRNTPARQARRAGKSMKQRRKRRAGERSRSLKKWRPLRTSLRRSRQRPPRTRRRVLPGRQILRQAPKPARPQVLRSRRRSSRARG